jgi:hypothetical protein
MKEINMTKSDKIGFYEQNITPTRKAFLAGFASRSTKMEGVQDPLYLRIMTLTDQHGQTAIMVTADLLYFLEDFSWRIRDGLNLNSISLVLTLF